MATNETVNNSPAGSAGELLENKPASVAEELQSADENLEASGASKDSDDEGEGSESDDAKAEEGKPKKEGGYSKRLKKLTKQRAEAQRELEYWKSEALKKAQAQETQLNETKKVATQSDDEPNPNDFETAAGYTKALAKWTYSQEKKADEAKQRESKVKEDYTKKLGSFQEKARIFAKSHSDFEELVGEADDIRMSPGIEEILVSSEFGAEALYELVKNRDEFERINALSPLAAAREIGKIEARIAQQQPSKEESKKQTNAPAPIKPVGGVQVGGVKKSVYDDGLSFAEYERLRRAQTKKRA